MPIRRMIRQRGSGNPELNDLEEGNGEAKGREVCPVVSSRVHVKWNHVNPDQFSKSV